MGRCMHCSLTVLALILLYGSHYSSVWFPSKVMLRFPTSCNNRPQQMIIFLDIIVTVACVLLMKPVLELLEMLCTDDLNGT